MGNNLKLNTVLDFVSQLLIDLPNPIEKSNTLTPKRRANEKCPSSWMKTIIEISTKKENIYTRKVINYFGDEKFKAIFFASSLNSKIVANDTEVKFILLLSA